MISKAFLFALKAHENQIRKNGVPYICHPFFVSMVLAKNGASDNLIIAGLLHDTVEDTSTSYEDLRSEFNDEIADIVAFDSEDKRLPWEKRKQMIIDSLKNTNNRDYHMLICADKLSNISDIEEDLKKDGEVVWSRFHRGKDLQENFYRSLVEVLEPISDLAMYKEFKEKVERVFDNGN